MAASSAPNSTPGAPGTVHTFACPLTSASVYAVASPLVEKNTVTGLPEESVNVSSHGPGEPGGACPTSLSREARSVTLAS